MTKTILKFTKHSGRYNAGEIAGFDTKTAEGYIAAGVAHAYTAPSTSIAALSTGADAERGMEQAREFARSEQARLHAQADAIQAREIEGNEKLDARERAVKDREDDVARREAALDQGQATGGTIGTATGDASIIAADQVGPLPPNGATPPTGEGHEGDKVTEQPAKAEAAADDLPTQGQAKKGK